MFSFATQQGVIGDTFYYDVASQNAATVDTPEVTALPSHLAEVVYPVFPDKVYELATLFQTPQVVFTGEFIREIIGQRVAIAHHIGKAMHHSVISK
jgi:hypothetical protein